MVQKLLLLYVLLACVSTSCKKTDLTKRSQSIMSVNNSTTSLGLGSKSGVVVDFSRSALDVNGYPNYGATQYLLNATTAADYAKDSLHVSYARFGIKFQDWNTPAGKSLMMNRYNAYKNNGFKIMLNANYVDTTGSTYNYPTGSTYSTWLSQVLTYIHSNSTSHTYPDWIVVQNEEGNAAYVTVSSTNATNYIGDLSQAYTVCNPLTIKITNGGFFCRNLVQLTYDWLYTNQGITVANNFIDQCLPPHLATALKNAASSDPTNHGITQDCIYWKAIMSQYAGTHIASINMHWYEPQKLQNWNTSLDGSAAPYENVISGQLGQVATYLKTVTGVTPILTNEVGQWTPSTTVNDNLLSALNTAGLNPMIWYDGDGPAKYSAVALHSSTSQTNPSMRTIGSNFAFEMQ